MWFEQVIKFMVHGTLSHMMQLKRRRLFPTTWKNSGSRTLGASFHFNSKESEECQIGKSIILSSFSLGTWHWYRRLQRGWKVRYSGWNGRGLAFLPKRNYFAQWVMKEIWKKPKWSPIRMLSTALDFVQQINLEISSWRYWNFVWYIGHSFTWRQGRIWCGVTGRYSYGASPQEGLRRWWFDTGEYFNHAPWTSLIISPKYPVMVVSHKVRAPKMSMSKVSVAEQFKFLLGSVGLKRCLSNLAIQRSWQRWQLAATRTLLSWTFLTFVSSYEKSVMSGRVERWLQCQVLFHHAPCQSFCSMRIIIK